MDQTPEGDPRLVHTLQATSHVPAAVLVVREATESYGINVAPQLVHAGWVGSVINPAPAHHVAKALLKRAKTETLAAQTLAP